MWSEAGPHAHTDHAAIAHAVGRWSQMTGRPYHATLEATCHGLRGGAARVAAERAKSWGPAAWERVLNTARAYFAGTLPDPCPGSHHWGGMRIERDRARIEARVAAGTWEVVRCKAPTANTFVREVRP